MEPISERLKKLRECLKLTQGALADQINIKRSTYAGYESGISSPQADLLEKLVMLFDVDSNWLLSGKGDMFVGNPSNKMESDERTAREEKIETLENQGARIKALEAENKELEAENKQLSEDLLEMVRKFVIAPKAAKA
jgi:transcriptional regulator with XRE-family HTH domain